MKIVFMGTPGFAVQSLEAILAAGFEVVAVVTAADKPAGRGQKIQESEVKKCALKHNLPILQPLKLKDPAFIEALKSYQADLQVVVAFRMLPEIVWNMPKKGTINLHASLLPNYRGAAPINHALINGEKETGVTTFFLKHEIDTGDILFSEKVAISESDSAGELHDNLMHVGANLLVKTLHAIESGTYQETPQVNENVAHHAPKLSKEFCRIQWHQTTDTIFNFIRGLSPYPAAYTTINNKTLKIFEVEKILETPTISPGAYTSDNKNYLYFATNDGYLSVKSIQLEGKKRMDIQELLRGYKVS